MHISQFFQLPHAIGFDANPLMTFISEVKTTWEIDLEQFKSEVQNVAQKFLRPLRLTCLEKGLFGIYAQKRT
ncbi:MAG: hypothetical protein NZ551_04145 [Microscillaceae bacterium]|nr:hypothetical protein [Microscillaceae bacterium]MDW8460382.1 hypothetical protein [Cytophagales bacterium]